MPERADHESEADWLARLEEWGWRDLAHRAAHSADREARTVMLDYVAARLQAGGELPPAARDWLLLVLGTLRGGDSIPTLHRGRESDPRAAWERAARAARRYTELERATPSQRVVDRIELIAHELGMSESAMRKLYKSTAFKNLLDSFRKR